jgi:hypothetical protein
VRAFLIVSQVVMPYMVIVKTRFPWADSRIRRTA